MKNQTSSMSRRDFLKLTGIAGAGAFLASCSSGPQAPVMEKELTVGSWGGVWDESTQKYIIDPLVKETGAKVTIVPGDSVEHYPKIISNPNNPPYDVLWLDLDYVAPLAAQNLLMPLTTSDVPELKDVYDNLKFFNGQAVAGNFGVLSLVYDSTALSTVDSWMRLWDQDVACKFLITPMDSWGIQWLIQADKLAGGDGTNLDNGIEKTKTLAPMVKALIGDYDQRTLWERKEISMGMIYSGEAYVSYKSGLTNIRLCKAKEGGVMIPNCIIIPKNAKNPNLAKRFVHYALAQEAQMGFINDYATAPVVKSIQLSEDLKTWMYTGDDVAKLMLPNYDVILKTKDAAAQRWNSEVVPLVGTKCG